MDEGDGRRPCLHLASPPHCIDIPAIGHAARDPLAGLIDLPPAFGGIGLQSLERSTDEEVVGSFTGISASLISFGRSTELPVYIAIAEAL